MTCDKDINAVFSAAKIPAAFNGCRVNKIKIDTNERGIDFILKLCPLLPYKEFVSLKEGLRRTYVLDKITAGVQTDEENVIQDLETYKDYVIGELADEEPVCKYLFTESIWEIKSGVAEITISNGGAQMLKTKRIDEKIKKIFARSGAAIEVSFSESIQEIEEQSYAPAVYVPRKEPESKEVPVFFLGKKIDGEAMKISELDEGSGKVVIEGELFYLDVRDIKNKKKLVIFYVSDGTGAVICKFFTPEQSYESIAEDFEKGIYVKVRGEVRYDTFENELAINAKDINKAEKRIKRDNAEKKRVELHAHTQMSAMDSVAGTKKIVDLARQYGHKAVAITDHGVVQAFPEALAAAKEKGREPIKILYGTESYLVDDCDAIIYKGGEYSINGELVVFDIETTGLSPSNDAITEIGAVKIKGGEVTDSFSTFVNPNRPIPEKIIQLTGITDNDVKNAPSQQEAVEAFLEFCAGAPLIAHNAEFDMGFIKAAMRRMGRAEALPYLDTLALCRAIVTEKSSHKLSVMAKHFGIPNPSHHRAVNDAEVCAAIWLKCAKILSEKGVKSLDGMESVLSGRGDAFKGRAYHAVIFAKNKEGLKNLYTLISLSHLNYFYRQPRIPKSLFLRHREGLLIGSACEAGELYQAVRGGDEKKIKALCEFYDYYEIQPLGNNMFMLEDGSVGSIEELENINKKIVELGEKYNKPVVATGDVHFLKPEDEVFRRILMSGKGFEDADKQAPLYFRTTAEMLHEFEYLGAETARQVVIENTNLIADMIEDMSPLSSERCTPVIEGSDKDIENMCREKAEEIYGSPLPEIVQKRMNRELDSIIKNGFAVMYMIAHKLVKKSMEDGYLVGSRGSVGSSLVAFLTEITEVNALPAHYVCPECKYSEFITDGSVGSGCDMPDKACPKCGSGLKKDGHDIPFETFLGFDGDKAPDIDLNFSGDYQAEAHRYTEELFGQGYTFKAGTIGTVAEKTAYGFIKKYYDEKGQRTGKAETERLVQGCAGVRRTTGQHPGGIIVLPKGHDINEFTPVQYPADDKDKNIITTHFDYHSIEDNLLKLDILGHDDPTVIKMLEELTGENAKKIPLDDERTMSIFLSTEALGVTKEEIGSQVGTFGVPEFGTGFVRQMLVETKPKSFSELIRISGLSHGTDVWTNNAQELVRGGVCTLSSAICTRDDIMTYLIYKGLKPLSAFAIMESVRKGRGLKPEWEEEMRENQVPEWYIESCKKIKYMFPKAHASAYVTMAFRIAYFKVHYPLAFYLAYFSVRADTFEYELMCSGIDRARQAIKNIRDKGNEALPKEKGLIPILEICVEMYARGIEFCPIDLYKSHAEKFIEQDGKIRPPLSSLPGVGVTAARSIAAERERGEFLAVDDMVKRTGITKTVVEMLAGAGCLSELPESTQLSLF